MDSHLKTLAKTISWRIIATLITATLAWLITREFSIAVTVGVADCFVKMLAYYIHERLWNHISKGGTSYPADTSGEGI